VIAGEALTEPELIHSTAAVLAFVIITGKQECVRYLPAEFSRYVNVPNQANHGGLGQGEGCTANHSHTVTFDYFCLAVQNEAQRSPDGDERQWFEGGVERKTVHGRSGSNSQTTLRDFTIIHQPTRTSKLRGAVTCCNGCGCVGRSPYGL
jgi:hypothetical protein